MQANWSEEAEKLLRNYTMEVFEATKSEGWDGHIVQQTNGTADTDVKSQWSFAGSLLFSITVITTIGALFYVINHTELVK